MEKFVLSKNIYIKVLESKTIVDLEMAFQEWRDNVIKLNSRKLITILNCEFNQIQETFLLCITYKLY